MNDRLTFTVLTPTFNRAGTLPALKASLDAQAFRDFEWLVVDDGSTDGTADLFAAWTATSAYPIRVLRCANGGKHRALNRGGPESHGRWIFIVDSDDHLPAGALEKINALLPEADADPGIGGIMGFRQDPKGRRIGEDFPPGLRRRDAATLTFIDGLRGDKAEVFKASVLRKFSFPEFQDEKFITECVVWFRIARAGFDLLLLREAIYTCEYQEDGLSAKSFELRLRNPNGALLFYAEELALPFPLHSLYREAANFVRFWLLSLGRREARGPALASRARFLVFIASPAGLLAAIIDVVRLVARKLKSR
ncbi:MAG: glycosyltransferase family 2 protein, partial [Rectinemataceae bacterium]|nr:glycosyltransferase family 2 protein [Rectinemataceae bacterium]